MPGNLSVVIIVSVLIALRKNHCIFNTQIELLRAEMISCVGLTQNNAKGGKVGAQIKQDCL